jgi:hypothetical protein
MKTGVLNIKMSMATRRFATFQHGMTGWQGQLRGRRRLLSNWPVFKLNIFAGFAVLLRLKGFLRL